MCYHVEQSFKAFEIEERYSATFEDETFVPSSYNGFTFPATPVITNSNVNLIRMFHWGLIPSWAPDTSIRKHTLNAKIETISEKASFKGCVNQRCLILVSKFFEWKWLDEKGKSKQKYEITFPHQEIFSLAGLYNSYIDKSSGELLNTYTILTTAANEVMAEIHNTKKRMPLMLLRNDEPGWLQGENYMNFAAFDGPLLTKMV